MRPRPLSLSISGYLGLSAMCNISQSEGTCAALHSAPSLNSVKIPFYGNVAGFIGTDTSIQNWETGLKLCPTLCCGLKQLNMANG